MTRNVNGVDVARLNETIDAINAAPSIAEFNFRCDNKWIDGALNRSTVKDFYGAGQEDTSRKTAFVFNNDEPDVLLGKDEGANPAEFLLHALAGCLTTTMVYHAAARGIKIDGIKTRLEGDINLHGFLGLDDTFRNGYEGITVSFAIEGDLTDDEKADLIQMARERSVVFDCVTNPVPVKLELDNS
jgi:uncharacterized OsmC-like protein